MIILTATGGREAVTLKKIIRPVHLIACGVFRPFLDTLMLEKRYPHVRLTFLPSNLHMFPNKLKNLLHREITSCQKTGQKVICLYGNCFPDMEIFCREQMVTKLPGDTCYEMLLGKKAFRKIMDKTAGTYFIEKELILNFEEYCINPLDLKDREMRTLFFRNYKRVIYLRQPSDPDLSKKTVELAGFLELLPEVCDADYTHLERDLMELLGLMMQQEDETEE
jgi:hypothetical protein